jgi:hypothetical protein
MLDAQMLLSYLLLDSVFTCGPQEEIASSSVTVRFAVTVQLGQMKKSPRVTKSENIPLSVHIICV